MKITKTQLKQIIKEELEKVMEGYFAASEDSVYRPLNPEEIAAAVEASKRKRTFSRPINYFKIIFSSKW